MSDRRATTTRQPCPSDTGVDDKRLLETPNSATPIQLLTGRRIVVGDRSPWEALEEIAIAQRNRVNVQQLLGAGFTRQMIRTAAWKRQLHRLHRGVFGVGSDIPIELGAETAALLTAPGLALSGASVLTALGLIPSDTRRPIDVVSFRRADPRPGIRVHRYRDLAPHQIRVLRGLPMTTVERALLDAADELGDRGLELAVDEALAARRTSRTKIRETAAAASGRSGRTKLLRLAEARRPNSQTKRQLAERALRLIRAANLPEPETEVRLLGFLMDFFFTEAGVVVEVDPHSIHGVIRANFNRDRRKARACREAGIELISVTGDDLTETPLVFISDLAQTIARRLAARGRAA